MHPVCTVCIPLEKICTQTLLCFTTHFVYAYHGHGCSVMFFFCTSYSILSMTVTVHCCLIVCISPCMHGILRLILQSDNFFTVTYCSSHCFSYNIVTHNTIAAFQVNCYNYVRQKVQQSQ